METKWFPASCGREGWRWKWMNRLMEWSITPAQQSVAIQWFVKWDRRERTPASVLRSTYPDRSVAVSTLIPALRSTSLACSMSARRWIQFRFDADARHWFIAIWIAIDRLTSRGNFSNADLNPLIMGGEFGNDSRTPLLCKWAELSMQIWRVKVIRSSGSSGHQQPSMEWLEILKDRQGSSSVLQKESL